MPFAVQKAIRDACGDRNLLHRGRIVGIALPARCAAHIPAAEASAAARVVLATPSLHEEMTRYVASIDQKVEILVTDHESTLQFRDRLLKTR